MSEQRIGVIYNIPPEPPKEANTRWFPAGAITIGLECRDLDPQSLHELYKDNPDHLKELQDQRQRARNQTLHLAFLNLGPQAEPYGRKLQEKRLNAPHHIQKIVALIEIYGPDKVGRALLDALRFEAIGCEYIANILAQREQPGIVPGALHLTHRQDLLDLEIPVPDLSLYETKP